MTQRQQQQQRVKAVPSFAVSSMILLLSISSLLLCQSFQIQSQFSSTRSSPSSSTRSSSSSSSRYSSLSSTLQRRSSSPHFYADPSLHDNEETASAAPSFEQRMREQLRQRQSIERQKQKISSYNTPTTTTTKSATNTRKTNALIPDVRSLEDYKNVLDQAAEDNKMVAVFWYSPWCKACKAASPGIKTIAKNHPQIQFIQVPVLEDNAVLHQGLNVPSVPYMHLYTPDDPRLVEECKMTRKKLSGFQKLLQDYEYGSCSLERLGLDSDDAGGGWSTTCPYSFSATTPSTNTNTVEVVTP
jgi:thiol-disulfide isomerase/thioredoxin